METVVQGVLSILVLVAIIVGIMNAPFFNPTL